MTGNLHAALTALRDESEKKYWWIDALCINQEDLEESALQVQRMTSIYRSAHRVIAWIGSQAQYGIELARFMDDMKHILETRNNAESLTLDYFSDIFARKYWSRVWVVQEVSVATNVIVMCGNCYISWEDFVDIMGDFLTKRLPDVFDIRRRTMQISRTPLTDAIA